MGSDRVWVFYSQYMIKSAAAPLHRHHQKLFPRVQDATHVYVDLLTADAKRQSVHFLCCVGPSTTQEEVLQRCGATQLMDTGHVLRRANLTVD